MSSHRFLPLLAGLTLLTSTALAQPQGSLFTANERDASLSEVRLATGQVNTHALAIAPHNVQVSPDGRLLLAVGMPAQPNMPGTTERRGSCWCLPATRSPARSSACRPARTRPMW